MNEYRIITVCNRIPRESYYCLYEFMKSLNGEEVSLLGTHEGEYGGLGSKPRLLYHAIKSGQIPEKHIIFSDCFDLVFAVPPTELFFKFKQFAAPFVISAEKNCFPSEYKEAYDKLPEQTSYKYLNSGMIVAETEAMLAVLESMDAPNIPNDYWDAEKQIQVNPNDQEFYMQQFLKQPVQMVMDTYQILCNTLHSVKLEELDFSEERIFNKETKSRPCAFHLNGSAKTDGLRNPILKHLNLI